MVPAKCWHLRPLKSDLLENKYMPKLLMRCCLLVLLSVSSMMVEAGGVDTLRQFYAGTTT